MNLVVERIDTYLGIVGVHIQGNGEAAHSRDTQCNRESPIGSYAVFDSLQIYAYRFSCQVCTCDMEGGGSQSRLADEAVCIGKRCRIAHILGSHFDIPTVRPVQCSRHIEAGRQDIGDTYILRYGCSRNGY